jgi:enhancing lycopene biosynthesis protein 2
MKTVAIVLGGCGRGDGSEIHESVSCLIHLSRLGIPYRCFAPDQDQVDVVDHASGKPMAQKRNLMVEAARISRGEISPLASLDVEAFAGVVFPGGFGAAKNLCTFAKDGVNCVVHPDVARVIKGFHARRKPIAVCCIAPVLAARTLGTALGGPGVEVTIGTDDGVASAIAAWGSRNVAKRVTEAHTDIAQRVVSTPAYMYGDATPAQVYEGVGRMVEQFAALANG